MNATTAMTLPAIERFKPQVVCPRPYQLETPDSYLARLCAANVIDLDHIRRRVHARRTRTRRPDELGYVINELGGPDIRHFHREYARTVPQLSVKAHMAFAVQPRTRPACSRCVHGVSVDAYDHRLFMICLKHNRWIGHRADEQQQISDLGLRTVERRFRQIATTGLISNQFHDGVTAALDRHAPVLRDGLWLGKQRQSHPQIDRYPALVRILTTIADYIDEYWPIEREIRTVHRRPEQARLYRSLRTSLAWLGGPAATWKLIDELVAVVIDSIIARSVEFAPDLDGLRLTSG